MTTTKTVPKAMRSVTLLLALLLLSPVLRAVTKTALANGNWSTDATWDLNDDPDAGDFAIIPAGITVSITSNLVYSGAAMRIRIYGTLSFVGGGAKIAMPCGSIVELMTPASTINGTSGGSSQTIKICNATVWSVSTNNNAHGPADYPTNATLPIELVSFIGAAEDRRVKLAWTTATEHDNAYFTVERSADGADFLPLATMQGAGDSQQNIDYVYYDPAPPQGTNYYRLRQTDLNGTSTASATIAVAYDPQTNPILFPNPFAEGVLTVSLSAPGATLAQVTVMDAHGRIVLDRALPMEQNGLVRLQRNMLGAAAPGAYTVLVSTAGSRDTFPLLLQ